MNCTNRIIAASLRTIFPTLKILFHKIYMVPYKFAWFTWCTKLQNITFSTEYFPAQWNFSEIRQNFAQRTRISPNRQNFSILSEISPNLTEFLLTQRNFSKFDRISLYWVKFLWILQNFFKLCGIYFTFVKVDGFFSAETLTVHICTILYNELVYILILITYRTYTKT